MKIQFSPDLDFQREAIASITDIFDGQETFQTNFTVARLDSSDGQDSLFDSGAVSDLGIGNQLKLLDEDVLKNVNMVQLRNGLAPSMALDSMDFTVEMETGTGKTYVYLRTIFELNRKYGFTKFIVVVPSVAIKEGTLKSLQMTEKHFKGLYENVNYDYFVYNSQKLGQVRNFATSDSIQIMVINIDAFRKSFVDPAQENKANIIHRPQDRMAGSKPIEFIQATNPIVIIDEPQSVDPKPKGQAAIASLNPLCTLRYSATHLERHNQMYRLDAVVAFERKLVKQVEVAGIDVEESHNRAYVKLLKVDNKKGSIKAHVEIDISGANGQIQRKKKIVRTGADLFELSGGRDVYDGYILEDILCTPGSECISFTSNSNVVYLGKTIGSVDQDVYKRLQIRKTIEEHLDKELALRPQGIKVLSLFFIDRVANYRWYDDEGNPRLGKYAVMFEEEYAKLITKPKYNDLFEGVETDTAADGVHDGYFAADRQKDTHGSARMKESRGEGKSAADESAYSLIMRNKEELLSLDSKLKFIFSHSALREGWDNPNVFQICTLNETTSVMKKRQEIGRGLRIAVNQDGERVHGFSVNTLTIMANESYEEFARTLQKEFEEDTGIRFGIVERHLFANIPIKTEDHEPKYFGNEASETIWEHLKDVGYIDVKGRIQDKLRSDLKTDQVDLPEIASEHSADILAALTKVAGSLNIKNADKRKRVRANKRVLLSPEFKDLWDRIKYRTTFRVDFDPEKLVQTCADEIAKSLIVGKAHLVYRKSKAEISRGGVQMGDATQQVQIYEEENLRPPDIVSFLQDETNLTRRSIVEILLRSKKLDQFQRNPRKFIELVTKIINHQMRLFIVEGIKYERIGDDDYYAQELFESEELYGYLSKNMLESKKSAFDHVVYDSDVEAQFAKSFESSRDVKVYAKLPNWFKIDTPLGSYNPDWAVLVERDGKEQLYFVVESKGSLLTDALRPTEQAKIDCGRAHFKALDSDIHFEVSDSISAFEASVDHAEEQTQSSAKDLAEVEEDEGAILPFKRLSEDEVEPYENCVPLFDLKVAAGGFGADPASEAEAWEWVAIPGPTTVGRDLFVAQVVGESMNERIPNGAWCLWRLRPTGSRQGKVVLAQHRGIQDPEHDGAYTVKVYESEKKPADDGGWAHDRVILKPDSSDSSFEPIVLEDLEEGELTIVAELVEVLG